MYLIQGFIIKKCQIFSDKKETWQKVPLCLISLARGWCMMKGDEASNFLTHILKG